MLRFFANNIDQLDLALEHITKGNFNDARFGLMLTDNVVEITLHQIATDKLIDLKNFGYMRKEYVHEAALQQALGRRFDRKVRFAKLEGKLSAEEAETISTLHAFRNEVYHIGIQHEPILPALLAHYFKSRCMSHEQVLEVNVVGGGGRSRTSFRQAPTPLATDLPVMRSKCFPGRSTSRTRR